MTNQNFASMNVDETALIFIVEYYETFANDRDKLANAYAEGARLILFNKDKQIMQCSQNFQNVVPNGVRKILSCSGEVISHDLFVHVQSTLTMPGSTDIVDECFRCQLTDSSILITYHSIHVNPIIAELPPLPPPVVKPAAPPKPAKTEPPKRPRPPAVEVNDPYALNSKLSVLVVNLPFNRPPSEFVKVLEDFGHVVKFAQSKGKLVAEFERFEEMKAATSKDHPEWNGRTPFVHRMKPGFTFN
ncbi:hypothetical protein TRFO_19534 [Tritrichomonas foetus]|uniref:RRM domain-containing protein n=1 Tax=Tritrichomonas foetus TaxID=1144522 RepID=A0A1J4KHU4_9EUKA|nr:hypothetical protein TRFO_19534 [Tritrichomonas foetus]|eukprot:OHT10961.1 hypothetical protein TRFO_19534 [Tritrichomonas foetus]